MTWIVPPPANVISPNVPPKYFCSDIAGVELVDGNVIVHLACLQRQVDAPDAAPHFVVEVMICWPLPKLPAAIWTMMRCLLPGAGRGANDNVVSLRDAAH